MELDVAVAIRKREEKQEKAEMKSVGGIGWRDQAVALSNCLGC